MATIRAGRFHGRAAVGTKNEPGFQQCRASRTRLRKLIAQNKINDDADTVGYQRGKKRPHYITHAAALRVCTDIADEQYPSGCEQERAVGESDLSDKRPVFHLLIGGNHYGQYQRRDPEITDDSEVPHRPWNYLQRFGEAAHAKLLS